MIPLQFFTQVEKPLETELRNNFQTPDLARFSSQNTGSMPGQPGHFPLNQPYIYPGFQGYPGTAQLYQYPQIQGSYQPTQGPHSHPIQYRTESSAQPVMHQPEVPNMTQLQTSVQPRSFDVNSTPAPPNQACAHLKGQTQSQQPPVTQSTFPSQGPFPSLSHALPTQSYPAQFQYLPQQGVQAPQLQMQMPRPQIQPTGPNQPQQNFVFQGQPAYHPGGQIPHAAFNPQLRTGAPGASLPQFQQQYQTRFGNQQVSNNVQHPSVVPSQQAGYFPGQQQNLIGQRPPNTQSPLSKAVTSQAQYTQGYQQYVQPASSIPNQVQHLRSPIPQGQTLPNQFVINQQQNFSGQQPDLGLSQGYIHRHAYHQQYQGVGLQSGPFVTQSGISNSAVSQGATVSTFSQAGPPSTTILSGNGPQFSPYNMGVSSQPFQPPPQQPKLRAVVPQPGTVPLTPIVPLQPVTLPQQGYVPVAQTIQLQPQSYPSGNVDSSFTIKPKQLPSKNIFSRCIYSTYVA